MRHWLEDEDVLTTEIVPLTDNSFATIYVYLDKGDEVLVAEAESVLAHGRVFPYTEVIGPRLSMLLVDHFGYEVWRNSIEVSSGLPQDYLDRIAAQHGLPKFRL